MSIENLILFVTVCFFASMTPGPGILAVITYSTYHGTKNSLPIILGILSGLFFLSIMAVLGLGVVLEFSKELFLWLQYIGAAYLFFLGVKTFGIKSHVSTVQESKQLKRSAIKLYLHGVGVSMVNPKALSFFSALFLPFINPAGNTILQFGILVLVLMCCSTLSLFFYSFGAQLLSPTVRKYSSLFNKITGASFIGLSVMLAISSEK